MTPPPEQTDPKRFPPTDHSLIDAVIHGEDSEAHHAMVTLCDLYRQPILNWLRRHGNPPHKAEDLTSGFIEHLLKKNRFKNFVWKQAKFRSFLLRCLKNFVHDQQRSGPNIAKETPLDQAPGLSTDPVPADHQLDSDLALEIHHKTLHRLETVYRERDQERRFELLKNYLLKSKATISYADDAAMLDMTVGSVKTAVHRLRENYFDTFRAEVRKLVTEGDLDDEVRYLVSLVLQQQESGHR